ncbi:MAG: aldolase/citrate lyase family protein [Burkholderiales bacterium]
MQPNKLKAKLRAGQVAVGSEIMFPSADAVEILAYAGLDFVYMDMEHSATTHESLAHMIRACEIGGSTPLVRIPESVPGEYPGVILRILDLGAMGVIVPHVDTREEAKAVVDAVKYAPQGRRGMFDVGRQTGYGTRMKPQDYVERANAETMVVIMIESTEGLGNIDDILSVDGIDVVQIGSSDLSASMGFRGDLAAPAVVEAIDRIVVATRKRGIAAGVGSFAGFSPERMRHYLDLGAQFVNITTQTLLLTGARVWREKVGQ